MLWRRFYLYALCASLIWSIDSSSFILSLKSSIDLCFKLKNFFYISMVLWGISLLLWDIWQCVFFRCFHNCGTAAAKSLQSCLTLCNPIEGSPPGSPIPGILQARTLEWVAISFSNAWKWKVKVKSLNRVRLLATPWTAAHQAPPSMGFSRQEYWSGMPLPSPWDCYQHLT